MAEPLDALRALDGPVAPRPEFVTDLRRRLASLQRSRPMITTAVVTPYLAVHDASAALDFYAVAFDAVETSRVPMPDGRLGHAEISIAGATIMLADEFPEADHLGPLARGGSSVTIHLQVDDADAAVASAVAAGATLTQPVEDQPHGNRHGAVVDPFGHRWIVSMPLGRTS